MTLSRQVCGWSRPQEGRLPAAATSTHRSIHLRRPGKRHLSTQKDTLARGSSSVYLLFFGACPPRSSGTPDFDRMIDMTQCGPSRNEFIMRHTNQPGAQASVCWSAGRHDGDTEGPRKYDQS